jgi:hypothetical protein
MDKFAREIMRRFRHGKEAEESIRAEDNENKSQEDPHNNAQDFHLFRDAIGLAASPEEFLSRVGWASRPPVSAPRRNNLLATREVKLLMCNPHGAASGIGHSLESSHREAGQANAAYNIRTSKRLQ